MQLQKNHERKATKEPLEFQLTLCFVCTTEISIMGWNPTMIFRERICSWVEKTYVFKEQDDAMMGRFPGHILLLCKFNDCQNEEKDVQSRFNLLKIREKDKHST